VSVDTIRFYEHKGLISPPKRTAAGYRQFGSEAIRRIHFIKRAQDCGFTLDEIKGLLSLRNSDDAGCADVKHKLQKKMSEVRGRIGELKHFLQALEALDEVCGGAGPISECPVLEALDFVENRHRHQKK
jgi:DNA-binding transcriptional MerR regulator